MVTSFIGIGSNLGNRKLYIEKAIRFLKTSKDIVVEKVSSIYETNPVEGSSNQGKFLNGVIKIKTSLRPVVLLERLQNIEKVLRRKRTVKNGPRTIDLDILTYGKQIIVEPNLLIPHPRLDKRKFVLRGFCQIAPNFVHPLLNKSIKEIYQESRIKNQGSRL